MSAEASGAASGVGSMPRGLIRALIVGLVLCDLLLLVFLEHAVVVAAAVVAVVGGVLLGKEMARIVAVIAVGASLLDPVATLLGGVPPVFWGLRAILAGGFAWLLLSRRGASWSAARTLVHPVLAIALLFGLLLVAGLVDTASPGYARMKILHYAATNLSLLGAGLLLGIEGPASHRSLWRGIAACALLVAVAGLANAALRFEPYESRLSVLGLNPIWLARIMAIGLLALLVLREAGDVAIPGLVAAGLPLLAVLVLSGSRGPLLGLLIVVLIRGFLLGRVAARTRVALLAGVLLLLAVVVIASPEALRERYLNPMRQDTSGVVRLRLFAVAQEIFTALPFAGVGTGGFSDLMKFGDHRFYPHNIFLEIGIENGIPGLIVLIAFLGVSLRSAAAVRHRLWGRAALLGLLFALWNAQFSGDVMANEWIWLFAGLAAGLQDARASV